ncbi:MAG TPA: UDP-N-acetylmuramate dehydrogenase [Chloroflexota bacterium]|nr:UDP-N-acetylmuramate dehydrogenase [Chloroflexota bacterium]
MTAPDTLARLRDRLAATAGLERVAVGASLAPHTTWRVGGAADLLCVATEVEGLIAAARAARELAVPWRVLGRGSNVLVRDGGVAGLVILNRTSELRIEPPAVTADAGLLLSTLARRTASAGMAGLEWSAGIPGSVGGAVVSNAGAHGGAIADTLRRALLLDSQAETSWVEAPSLKLAYRHSRLREGDAPEEIVLRADFTLLLDDPAQLRVRMEEQKRQRKATQPTSQASAGSVFKNPPGDSAARLIDQAGLKGTWIGGAQVSSLHANFMVTKEGARAADVLALIALVRERVQARFGVSLVLEVQPIGY